ncbi:MAG: deoxynucleoside kinase, partial [Chloroflexota bacterium]
MTQQFNRISSQSTSLPVTQNKCFVAVAGNIGAGKSSLTRLLADHFGWQPFYEANAENPYLADFYADMQRWSFHSQMFFLGKRLEHHRLLVDHPGSA